MQQISGAELRKRLEERVYWKKIQNGKLLAKVRKTVPATITPGGISQIVSYWDEHLQYLCTLHKVFTREGQVIHEDIKDACLDGVRYKAI